MTSLLVEALAMKAFLLVLVCGVSLAVAQQSDNKQSEALSNDDSSLISRILRQEYTYSPYYLLLPLNPCKYC